MEEKKREIYKANVRATEYEAQVEYLAGIFHTLYFINLSTL